MSEWVETTLGRCFDLVKTKASPTMLDPEYPYVGMEHVIPDTPRIGVRGRAGDVTSQVGVFEPGDVLFGRLRAYLRKVALADFAGVASTEVLILRPHQHDVVPGFLYLLASSPACLDAAVAKSAGSRMPRTSVADLGAFPVALPPLAEQSRFVDIMAAVDAQIEALEVESVRLASTTVRLRDDIFGSLASAKIPAGQKFDMLLGRQRSARQSVGEHVLPYLRAANITTGSLKLADVQTMNFDPHEQDKYGLQVDDIVLVEGGSLGQAARWQGEIDGVVGFDKHVIRLRAREGLSTSEYALQWCHWARHTGQFDAQATGITIKALGFGRASAMPVPDLDLDGQGRVTQPLAAADAEVVAGLGELHRLRGFRSTLLTSLLNQDVDIPASYDALLTTDLFERTA